MNSIKPLYSYHIFLFPFKWKMDEKMSNPENLNAFIGVLKEAGWSSLAKEKPNSESKDFNNAKEYNEFIYFHPFAQEALYDEVGNDNIRQLAYQISEEQPLFYEIGVYEQSPHLLRIDKIRLNVYSTGIGVLSFHLANEEKEKEGEGEGEGEKKDDDTRRYKEKFEEVLNINNLGRRIYPPYLKEPETVIDEEGKDVTISGLQTTKKNKSLADYIVLKKLTEEIKESREDFERFGTSKKFVPPNFIAYLFPNNFFTQYAIKQVLDERMFVMSWCGDDKIANPLNTGLSANNYLKSNDWFRYLFVDGPNDKEVSANNNIFQERLLEKHSYPRWVGGGTIYGVTRYSFVGLTNSGEEWLAVHIQTMYYKMVELCLMQRASLLQFSKRIADITHEISPLENAKKTARLNKDYLHFINNIHFTEITPQEQGIELYNMLQDHLEIDRDRVELNQEIQELHNYMNILAEAQRNEVESKKGKALELLTVLGALLVLPSFILGYYGLGVLGEDFPTGITQVIILIITLLVVVLFSLGFNYYRQNQLNKNISNACGIMALLVTAFAIILPFLPCWDSTKESQVTPPQLWDTIRIGQPIIISIDSSKTIELNPDNFYFIQPKK